MLFSIFCSQNLQKWVKVIFANWKRGRQNKRGSLLGRSRIIFFVTRKIFSFKSKKIVSYFHFCGLWKFYIEVHILLYESISFVVLFTFVIGRIYSLLCYLKTFRSFSRILHNFPIYHRLIIRLATPVDIGKTIKPISVTFFVTKVDVVEISTNVAKTFLYCSWLFLFYKFLLTLLFFNFKVGYHAFDIVNRHIETIYITYCLLQSFLKTVTGSIGEEGYCSRHFYILKSEQNFKDVTFCRYDKNSKRLIKKIRLL